MTMPPESEPKPQANGCAHEFIYIGDGVMSCWKCGEEKPLSESENQTQTKPQ